MRDVAAPSYRSGDEDPYRWGVGYSELIAAMEFDRELIDVTDNDYQGDTYMLVRKVGQYGVLTFGWGSCSGCDSAEAVTSLEEANALRDEIYHDIRWFDTAEELYAWVDSDHQLQHYGHDRAFGRFIAELQERRADLMVTEAEIEAAKASILGQ